MTHLGGTMRLGASVTRLVDGTKAREAYQHAQAVERHRHRYEFNNKYREAFGSRGMALSGVYDASDLVELIELKDHPWFVACQFHPEFKSRPLEPHPLFRAFVAASLQHAGGSPAPSVVPAPSGSHPEIREEAPVVPSPRRRK